MYSTNDDKDDNDGEDNYDDPDDADRTAAPCSGVDAEGACSVD